MDKIAQARVQLARVAHRFSELRQDVSLEQLAPRLERLPLDVTAGQNHDVKNVINDRDVSAVVLQRAERWPPVVIQRDELAVNHRLVRQLRKTAHDGWIADAEVVVVAGAQVNLAA